MSSYPKIVVEIQGYRKGTDKETTVHKKVSVWRSAYPDDKAFARKMKRTLQKLIVYAYTHDCMEIYFCIHELSNPKES